MPQIADFVIYYWTYLYLSGFIITAIIYCNIVVNSILCLRGCRWLTVVVWQRQRMSHMAPTINNNNFAEGNPKVKFGEKREVHAVSWLMDRYCTIVAYKSRA